MSEPIGTPISRQPPRAASQFERLASHPALLSFLLLVATLAVFWLVGRFDFVNFDDPDYVSANPQVQKGLTVGGLSWAFRTGHAGNWHPLTWISHMLDAQVFGPGPMGPHAVNLFFHATNTL